MPTKKKPKAPSASNDRISLAINDIVPKNLRGTERFLDIVCWNLKWFKSSAPQDQTRVKTVTDILDQINADIFVFEEVMEGSLETVADELRKRGAGDYEIHYGTTGGNQRVAIMHDLDYIRTKDTVAELFSKGQITVDGKDAFPRLPLKGFYTGLTKTEDAFDFQLIGVHMKSQMGGGEDQRAAAAEALSDWMVNESPKIDRDVLVMGDMNKPASSADWQAFHALEQQKKILFQTINSDNEISHLMYTNKEDIGSRLDLVIVATVAEHEIESKPDVIEWVPLTRLLQTDPSAKALKQYIGLIRDKISDHMPVVTRFYFSGN